MASDFPKLLTPGHAASLLYVTSRYLTKLAKDGKVPNVVLPNGDILFEPDELAKWVRSHRVGTAADEEGGAGGAGAGRGAEHPDDVQDAEFVVVQGAPA